MGIFIDDDDDAESSIETLDSKESHEATSPVEERLQSLAVNNKMLKEAIEKNDTEAIEGIKFQVITYKEELETAHQEIAEIDSLIEKETDSKVSLSVLTNEKMRLERWIQKVEEYIARYDSYLGGTTAPQEKDGAFVANLIKLWHDRVQENIQTLQHAIEDNDQHAIDLLGNSLESYTEKEADFEKAISDIHERLKSNELSLSVRTILLNDEIYLLDLLDDIRYYITEYRRLLNTQLKGALETI